jgi:hypothetical protein
MTQIFDLTLHQIRITCEVVTPVHFGVHAGAQWRGALWDSLRGFACTDPSQQGNPAHSWHCPMCFVLSLEAESPRGVNPARPLIIRPPLAVRADEDCLFQTGHSFTLELVLVGAAWNVYPYLLQAIQRIGQQGIGFGRGRFVLQRVEALNPFNQETSVLYESSGTARMPDIPITARQVEARAETLPADQVRLHFLTPTQLICDDKMLPRPQPSVLVMRSLERLQSLEYHYGTVVPQDTAQHVWKSRHETLSRLAESIRIRRDETRWIRAYSGSKRAKRMQDVSGFVGSVFLEGDMAPLKLWFLWASLVNVGKNAIKGNGWFEVSR